MGFISHHIMTLVIISLGGGYTHTHTHTLTHRHTHTHTHTHTHKHTDSCLHRNNFKKPGMRQPVAGMHLV